MGKGSSTSDGDEMRGRPEVILAELSNKGEHRGCKGARNQSTAFNNCSRLFAVDPGIGVEERRKEIRGRRGDRNEAVGRRISKPLPQE